MPEMTIENALAIMHAAFNIANRAPLANGQDTMTHSRALLDAEATIRAALAPAPEAPKEPR